MSFLYPHTVSIARPEAQAGEGAMDYGGKTQAGETVIAQSIPAAFDLRREGQKNPTGIPGDGTRPTYDCRIPRKALARGAVKNLDIVIDEEGLRYQVVGPFWASMGYALRVELLAP